MCHVICQMTTTTDLQETRRVMVETMVHEPTVIADFKAKMKAV